MPARIKANSKLFSGLLLLALSASAALLVSCASPPTDPAATPMSLEDFLGTYDGEPIVAEEDESFEIDLTLPSAEELDNPGVLPTPTPKPEIIPLASAPTSTPVVDISGGGVVRNTDIPDDRVGIGSARGDALRVLGQPDSKVGDKWTYLRDDGSESTISFDKDTGYISEWANESPDFPVHISVTPSGNPGTTISLGSTKAEVLAILGPPTGIDASLEIWMGWVDWSYYVPNSSPAVFSQVRFSADELVIFWNNPADLLPVKINPIGKSTDSEYITMGTPDTDVLTLHGPPVSIDASNEPMNKRIIWQWAAPEGKSEGSIVTISSGTGLVTKWSNLGDDLVLAGTIPATPTRVPFPSPTPTIGPSPTPTAAPTPTPLPTMIPTSILVMHSWRTGNNEAHKKLWVQNSIGTVPRELPVSVHLGGIRLSPNLRQIAIRLADGIRIVTHSGAETLNIKSVKNGAKNSVYEIRGMAWSSNSSLMVVGSGYDSFGNQTEGVWTFDTATGETSIYFDFYQYEKIGTALDVRDDGTIVLSLHNVNSDVGQLWLLKPDGRTLYKISDSNMSKLSPRWSPDGSQILFRSGSSTHMMNDNGTGEKLVVPNLWNAVWSPDGKYIAGTVGSEDSYTTQIDYFDLDKKIRGVIAQYSSTLDWN